MQPEKIKADFGSSLAIAVGTVMALLCGIAIVFQPAYPGEKPGDAFFQNTPANSTELPESVRVGLEARQRPTRPFTQWTLELNRDFLDSQTDSYLAINVLLHAVTACLLFRFLWLLGTAVGLTSNLERLFIGSIVILWAVHPMNVTAVAYIQQRSECLMACCFLVATIESLKYLQSRKAYRLIFAIAFGLLATLAKETAVVLPLIPWLLSSVLPNSVAPARRATWTVSILLLTTWIAVAIYTVPQWNACRTFLLDTNRGMIDYLVNQCQVIFHYLSAFAWPSHLSVVYDWPTYAIDGRAILVAVSASLCVVGGMYLLKKRQLIGAGVLWFLATLAPTSSLLPLREMAEDNRVYLPMVGLLIAMIGLFHTAGSAIPRSASYARMTLFCMILVWIVPILGYSRFQASHFKSRLAIWENAFYSDLAPHKASLELSTIYLELGDFEKAASFSKQHLDFNPKSTKAWGNLVTALWKSGQTSEAETTLANAMQTVEDDGSLSFALGNMLSAKDAGQAIGCFERTIKLDPTHDGAWNNLGVLLAREEAMQSRAKLCYETALAIRKGNRSAYQNLAALHIKSGKLYDAREVLTAARNEFQQDNDIQARLLAVTKLIRDQEQRQSRK